MDVVAIFSLGALAGVSTVAAVVYYKARRLFDLGQLSNLFARQQVKLSRLPEADVLEYSSGGSTYHMLMPRRDSELFDTSLYHYTFEFDHGAKVKTVFPPGRWLAGTFNDYGIKRLVVRVEDIDGTRHAPIEVFDADVDDGNREIRSVVRDALRCNHHLNCCSSDSSSDSSDVITSVEHDVAELSMKIMQHVFSVVKDKPE